MAKQSQTWYRCTCGFENEDVPPMEAHIKHAFPPTAFIHQFHTMVETDKDRLYIEDLRKKLPNGLNPTGHHYSHGLPTTW